jgi:hypothetical protein
MEIRFHIDPETRLPHILDHGVTEMEVTEILRGPGEDRAGNEDSRVAIGQTVAGRYLKVIMSGIQSTTAYSLSRRTI